MIQQAKATSDTRALNVVPALIADLGDPHAVRLAGHGPGCAEDRKGWLFRASRSHDGTALSEKNGGAGARAGNDGA